MIRTICMPVLLWLALVGSAQAQLLRCVEDSPERRGEPGCSIVASKRLSSPPQQPVLWHIDKFESLAAAQRAAGEAGVAFTAHGSAWLYTIEGVVSDHHGGEHVGVVGPLLIEPRRPYAIQVLSSYFLPGHFSIVHTHSGPEAWWVLEGEQCLATATTTIRARAGEGAIVAAGATMQMVGVGTGPRRSLVLVLHDADLPPSTVVDNSPPLKSCE